jgi:hypothetical protein
MRKTQRADQLHLKTAGVPRFINMDIAIATYRCLWRYIRQRPTESH